MNNAIDDDSQMERTTIRAAFFRLLPLLLLAYVLAYIDRINVGFAALTMNADIGLNSYSFGLGAGLFFWGYFFFEIPSNLMLEKFGARRWIARIMFTWGLLSMAMMFVKGPTSFLALRFILGVAEAGFFPGVILYLTYWFPAVYRARIIAVFMLAIPVSLALGAPISTGILGLNGMGGLKGWQWLFLMEGAPTVLLSLVVLNVLPDRPVDAKWLSPEQRQWLQARVDRERKDVEAVHGGMTLRRTFMDPRVLGLSFIYFANTTTNLGLAFFLPQIIKKLGYSNVQTGFLTSIPYVFGTLGILVWGYVSDKYNERRFSLTLALLVSAIGLAGTAYLGNTLSAIIMMSVAAIGIYGTKAPFWPLPSMFLTGTAAAGGIALINSIGNLGGFAGPYIVGWVREVTKSFEGGLYALAGIALSASIVALLIVKSNPKAQSTKA